MDYVPVSRLSRKAPAQYVRSFLEVEQDEGDLTYFLIWHAQIILRGISDLHKYLARKSKEMEQATRLLRHTNLNNRQIGVIEEALRSPSFIVTAAAHADKYRVTAQTAHADLRGSDEAGVSSGTRFPSSTTEFSVLEGREYRVVVGREPAPASCV